MKSNTNMKSYICSSAYWDCLIESASSPMDAASQALAEQIDSPSQTFSVSSTIKVTPITLRTKETEEFYAPTILADMGMHQFAADLSNQLEDLDKLLKEMEKEETKKKKKKK